MAARFVRSGQSVCFGWRVRGFTVIELLVSITVVAALVTALLPAISTAQTNSLVQQCQLTEGTIITAASQYATDNQSLIPFRSGWDSYDWGLTDASWDSQEFGNNWNGGNGGSSAGSQIWAERPLTPTPWFENSGGNNYNYTAGSAENFACGIGQLIQGSESSSNPAMRASTGGYLSLADAWCPATQSLAFDELAGTSWSRQQYFGYKLTFPFAVNDALSPSDGNWSPYGGGSNYYLTGSYNWRAGSHSHANSATNPTAVYGPDDFGATARLAKTTYPGFTNRTLIWDYTDGFGDSGCLAHVGTGGGNAGFGDGSVSFVAGGASPALPGLGWYTWNGPVSYPTTGNDYWPEIISLYLDSWKLGTPGVLNTSANF